MKRTLKRTLSALLVLCLFVGLMPQIAPEQEIVAQAAATTMYYDFTKANTGSYGSTAAAKLSAFQALTYDAVAALNTSITSAPWAYHSYSYVSEDGTEASAFSGYGYSGMGLVVVPASRKSDMTTAVKVKVSSAGKYVPYLNIHGGYFKHYAGTVTVKLRALNSDGSLGSTLASKELFLSDYPEANTYVPISAKSVSLSATEYALEFVINNERTILAVDGLQLVAADSNIASTLEINGSDTYFEVKVGETITAPFSVTLSDGTTAGKMTGWGWDSNSYVTANVNSSSRYITLTGVTATTKPQTIEFRVGAYAKAKVNVVVRAANYKPTATDLYYDFTKVLPDSLTVNHVHNISKFIKYNHTQVGGYGEINAWTGTASATSVFSQPWKVASVASTVTFSPLFHNYGIQSKKQGITDLKIKVPADGMYLPQLNLYQALGTPVKMSIINSSGTTLSTKTLAAGTSGTRVNFADTAISLKAGEYTVRFNKTETGSDVESGANYYDGMYFAYKAPIGTKLNMNANRNITMSVGGSASTKLNLSMSDGSAVDYTNGKTTVSVDNTAIATATTSGSGSSTTVKFTSKAAGTTSATITFTNGVFKASQTVIISSSASTKLYMSATKTALKPTDTAGSQITVKTADGAVIDNSTITFKSANTKVATVSSAGLIKPVAVGKTNINAALTYGGTTYNLYIEVKVTEGKTSSSWYTTASGRRSGSSSAVTNSNKYLNAFTLDDLWYLIPTQELPRAAAVGHRYDVDSYTCRYCGLDLQASSYGAYGWKLDVINDPWTVTCPSCTRVFPSNDFASFYKLGFDTDGNWSLSKAKSENQKLVNAGKTGYLTNTRHPEKGTGWGVDDGYGYHSGTYKVNSKGENAEQVHTYIAYYIHWGIWYNYGNNTNGGMMQKMLENFPSAYFKSGDIKYGRAAAVLVDRIADVYPDLYLEPYFPEFSNSDSTQPKGKMVGSIWQHTLSRVAMLTYDAVYDAFEDPTVVEAISEKAKEYDLGSSKLTTVAIRDRIEERLILQTYKDIRNGNIHGNFGMHQSCAAYAGVIYDTMPKTKEILDWVYAASNSTYGDADITGGNVNAQLVNLVDRDGHGAESAPNYNELWGRNLTLLADAVDGYTTYEAGNLYQNPRFKLMLKAFLPIILVRNQVAQIGDSGSVGGKTFIIQDQFLRAGWVNTKDVEFAQFLYHKHRDNPNGIASSVRKEVIAAVEEHGEYDFDKSRQLSGYGFSILRDGTYKENSDGSITDTQRDFWLYYGAANSHKHGDVLNLGIEAYGVNVAPDLGYPTNADGSDLQNYWESGTIMHNTVMTNDQSHNRIKSYNNGNHRVNSKPLHFDDSGRVKVMDVDAPKSATNGTASNGIFRRSIVMVKVNDEVSYGVDFFRVKGGNEHLYNFHAMSDEVYSTEGLTLAAQSGGSYAGADVAYKTKGIASGFSYLNNVRRATNCSSGNFAIDFKIKDFRNDWEKDMNLHLRINMVNGFALSEVAIASGEPPKRDSNPEKIEFMMARRSGSNLDSLFTAVYEPYKDSRYISSISSVSIARTGGATEGTNDVAKAVKVVRTDGITDYIVYATNNQVTYKVDGKYTFQGVLGVISLKNGSVFYAYGNDATNVNGTTSTAAYTGTVVDFTKTLTLENHIDVQFDTAINASTLVGKHLDIENGRPENAVMEIYGVTDLGSNKYRLDLGEKSLVTILNGDGSYIYNAAAGNTVRVPLPTVVSSSTVTLDPNGGTAGTKTSVTVSYGANMPGVDGEGYLPTRTGYRFGGYFDTKDATGTQYYTKNGKSNHVWDKSDPTATLYAYWNVNTYSVAYNANGGSGSMSNSSHTYDTAKNLTANAFTKTGYTFAGWNTKADGSGTNYADKASVKNLSAENQATVTLYAKWTPITYTVKYNANGGSGSMSSSSHTYDTAKNLTANAFTKTGSTFAGWATSASGSVAYADKASVKNLSSTSGATVNLYAKWTASTSTVTLSEGGTVTATYGSAMPTITPPTKAGKIFNGYFDASSGGTKYYNADGTSAKNWDKTGAQTLYAQWTAGKVTFTATGDKSVTATKSLSFTLSASTNLGTSITYSSDNLPSGASLSGNKFSWTPTVSQIGTHTVTFKASDGYNTATTSTKITVTAPKATVSLSEGGTVEATYGQAMPAITVPSKNGYIFGGYYDKANGEGNMYYKADGTSAKNWDKTGTATLYANWIKGEVTITQIEDKTVLADEKLSFKVEAESTAPGTITYTAENLPEGATFNAATGEFSWTPTVAQAGEYTITFKGSDGVSYAQVTVKVNVVTVASTITLDNGTTTSKVTGVNGEALPKITVPEKAGFVFGGYYTGRDGSGTKYYNADGTGARVWDKSGNVTLYAKWIEGSDIFGTTGVFMRNIKLSDGQYQIHIFAGIDSLKYREVGFEVTVGGETYELSTSTVFNRIVAKNGNVTPDKLGDKCNSIFAQTLVFSADKKSEAVTYRPYAIDKQGNHIYGRYVTIDCIYRD